MYLDEGNVKIVQQIQSVPSKPFFSLGFGSRREWVKSPLFGPLGRFRFTFCPRGTTGTKLKSLSEMPYQLSPEQMSPSLCIVEVSGPELSDEYIQHRCPKTINNLLTLV